MTLEELAAQVAAMKEITDAQANEITALKAKNAEIITEKRTLRDELNALKSPKPEDKKDDKQPEDKSAAAARRRIEAEIADRVKALEDNNAALKRERDEALVNTHLDEALQKVPAATRAAVKALLKTSKKIEVENGAVLCDGKAVRDSVSEWLATPEGKAFIPAPANGGSAAPGGASGAAPKKRSEMTAAEKGAYAREHGHSAYMQLPA